MNLDPAALFARLDAYPRLSLAEYPTPLQFLPRLSHELNRPIYIKRDDEIGPAMGGNKTRKLEYLMADAQQRKARKVVTFGGVQSNHARLTAAVARQCNMEAHLFYFERRPPHLLGNLLLNQLLGAKMHFIPFGGGGDASMTIEADDSSGAVGRAAASGSALLHPGRRAHLARLSGLRAGCGRNRRAGPRGRN